jgi:hypothetical protein
MVKMGVWPVTLLVLVVWCMWGGVGGAHWQKEVRMGYVSQFVEEYATSKRWPAATARRTMLSTATCYFSVKFCGDLFGVKDVFGVLGSQVVTPYGLSKLSEDHMRAAKEAIA